jgi:putative membrane protein
MKRGALTLALAMLVAAVALAGAGMTGHMAGHMVAVALAAPLLAFAAHHTALDPARLHPSLANPLAVSVIELVVVWSWHLPAVRAAVMHGSPLMLVEIACFVGIGTFLWSAVLAAPAAGVAALLLTSMHMTLLGALIGLAPRLLYPGAAHAAPAGLTPMEDQQLAGVVMLLIGGVSYLAGGLIMLNGMLRQEKGAA